MNKNSEYVRRSRHKKKALEAGAKEVRFFALPDVLDFMKRSLTNRLKVVRSKETRDNIVEILRELSKYE